MVMLLTAHSTTRSVPLLCPIGQTASAGSRTLLTSVKADLFLSGASMSRVKRVSTAVSSVAFAILLSSSPASAQGTTTADGYHNAHRLGGSTSFYKPPLTNVASLKRMAGARGMEADIRKVFADSGIQGTSDAVLAVLPVLGRRPRALLT
jgi:hypothetical protein